MHIIVTVLSQIPIINQYFGQKIGMDGMAMPYDLHIQFSQFYSFPPHPLVFKFLVHLAQKM